MRGDLEAVSPPRVFAPRWYVVRDWSRPSGQNDKIRRVAHAKQAGTILSACGANTTPWSKEPDVSFPPTSGPVCDECRSAAFPDPR